METEMKRIFAISALTLSLAMPAMAFNVDLQLPYLTFPEQTPVSTDATKDASTKSLFGPSK